MFFSHVVQQQDNKKFTVRHKDAAIVSSNKPRMSGLASDFPIRSILLFYSVVSADEPIHNILSLNFEHFPPER